MTASKTSSPRRRLGRGLGSLITAPAIVEAVETSAAEPGTPPSGAPAAVPSVPVDRIRPNPHQPRKAFDEAALDALAASIRSSGLMQPIVVRPLGEGDYELVAGERRWRAAQRAGLETIPALVRDADDRQSAEWSLVENLQREDLNAIERAEAFRRLIDQFGMTHKEIATLAGMDRSSVTNHLRVLELDAQIQELVRMELLGLAHARVLLSLDDRDARRRLAVRAAREAWSVRVMEREVGRLAAPASPPTAAVVSGRRANLADLEQRLSDHLGTRVRIRPGKKKGSGTLMIEFFEAGQFEGIVSRLGFSVDGQ